MRRKWIRWSGIVALVAGLEIIGSGGLLVYAESTGVTPQSKEYEYVEEVERDYTLRQIKPLLITNVRGDVSVQGWSLDKVRIKFRKKVLSQSPILASQLLSAMDYRYTFSGPQLEVSSQYGKGLSIEDRLHENQKPKVRLEMVVFAPSQLNLTLWGVDGHLTLKNWSAPAEIRTRSGSVQIENFRGNLVSLTCAECSAQFRNVSGSIRSFTGKGSVQLENVSGKKIFVETGAGPIRLANVAGDQFYTTKTGPMEGDGLSGKIAFHAQDSAIHFQKLSGYLGGVLDQGSLRARVTDWKPTEQSIIETHSASVDLMLPSSFSANVDIWSKQGAAEVKFPVVPLADTDGPGPHSPGRLTGRVRGGGELLQILSESGQIILQRS